ncbi:lipid IV(A) 3-deoxy-D-manno-octulosonic acid transferase [Solimicrobium silvestre]|uniref:3-deoxy-D-manno-octulosonic acid transferase n=1 Tax=Solimicrobium silvestre TaxID=2099400 RepID=A0A2S9GXI2_9BURK|nr:lipid IV(A) 3-deoxy-D-manno-octulosonic acid transferase [Solimicrobium silvestre]PRC92434.1 3-deoxy-D-manno-octulosonic-acid transferase [Solimicrobium silvestre]
MRILYTFVWILALPLVLARLFWRGRLEPGYRQHIAERFGFYSAASKPKQAVIWVHAVSVGETRAAEPLIKQLMQAYPQHRILLSHMTPTGRATGALLFANELSNNTVQQCFLPYDIPYLVRRLLTHFKPTICILMETEVWPNLIYACRQQAVPVTLVNARLSPKSLKKAERLSSLILPASAALTCVAAQTEADAKRILQLGAPKVLVTGNSKFDVSLNPEQISAGHTLREQFGSRPVLLCASTREGEEDLILDAFMQVQNSNLLLIIVPRHPQRFDLVEQLIKQRGLTMERRTTLAQNKLADEVRVVLGDTMGEMASYYVSSDIAFIGGSLLPLGGQNLIEACAVEKPVLIGPHTFNFEAISVDAIEAKGALRIYNAAQLFEETGKLIQDRERKTTMGKCALAFAEQHRGATARTLALLREYIH